MSTLPANQRDDVKRVQRLALVVGVVGLVVCIIGAPFSPAQFFRAYLVVYQFYLAIALGCLVLLMLYHLTGGAWGFLLRRFFEAGMRTLPLLAVLFTPIACAVALNYPHKLFLWSEPEVVAGNRELKYNHIYLNDAFFYGRAALYFVCWNLIAFILGRWSWQQDQTGEPHLPRKFRLLAAPSMVVYGATITFASVDWGMSLQPTFHSTMFGPLYATGQLVSAMAFVVLVLVWMVSRPPFSSLMSVEVLNDIGNLLFTFLIIWAYMAFFQFMLIWMANLPEEVIWYLPRSRNGWQWVAWAVFVFHFAIPFFALLMREVKRNPLALARVAALILGMHLVYMYWMLMPAFATVAPNLGQHWMDFLMPFGLGGIWLAFFLWQLQRYPVLPRHDVSREEAVHLHQLDLEAAARQEATGHG